MGDNFFELEDQLAALSKVIKEALDIRGELTTADTAGIHDLMEAQKMLLESMLMMAHLAGPAGCGCCDDADNYDG